MRLTHNKVNLTSFLKVIKIGEKQISKHFQDPFSEYNVFVTNSY